MVLAIESTYSLFTLFPAGPESKLFIFEKLTMPWLNLSIDCCFARFSLLQLNIEAATAAITIRIDNRFI